MRAGVGYSQSPDAGSAGRLAAASAAGPVGRDRVGTLFLFAVGPHASHAEVVARGASKTCPAATIVVIGGPGAFMPDGEVEGVPAVVALALKTGSHVSVGGSDDASVVGESLLHRPARPLLLFGKRSLPPARLGEFARASRAFSLVGGAVDPGGSLATIEDGELRGGNLLGARIDGGLRMATDHSVGVHDIGLEREVTRADSGYVRELDGRSPLAVLGRVIGDREDRPLVLVRWRVGDEESGTSIVRGIGGIDPASGAIYVGPDVREGDFITYCTPDATAGREDLRAMLKRLDAGLFGGIPVAAIAIESVGRGTRLHGRPHVDARALRRHFGDMPFAGVRTTHEVVRQGEDLRVAGHSLVLGLLFAPS